MGLRDIFAKLGGSKAGTPKIEGAISRDINPQAANLGRFLRKRIRLSTTLPEAMDIFEEMCRIPTSSEMDMKLFEGGVFEFGGVERFHFHLVRQLQFPEDEDEYTQVQLTAFYEPLKEYEERFHGHTWDMDLDDESSFFEFVRNSERYRFFEQLQPIGYEIYAEQT